MDVSWLESARQFIEETVLALGYSGVGLLMALENLFPPRCSSSRRSGFGHIARRECP